MGGISQTMVETVAGAATRRNFLRAGFALAGTVALASSARAGSGLTSLMVGPKAVSAVPPYAPPPAPPAPRLAVRAPLLERAKEALDRHAHLVAHRDRIAIADFAAPSSQGRLHLVDLEAGKVTTLLVAHGSGSDPDHTGFLQRFSNEVESNASCEGAFRVGSYYVGRHGASQRLEGLDPTNSNALERAIVIHGAWYAEPDIISTHGKLGRSQGCFAVGEAALDTVFTHLGQDRLLFSAKV